MIEKLSEAMDAALVCNNFWLIPLKISFQLKKKWLVASQYLQGINLKGFWTESSQVW